MMTRGLRNEGKGRCIAPGATPRTLRLTADWIAVRELTPPPHDGLVYVAPTGVQPCTVITGIVELVGPGRRTKRGVLLPVEVVVGQTVYFPAEAGRARLPWDFPVRIMREDDLSGVVEQAVPCPGMAPEGHVTPDDGGVTCC